jgi:hypothetical protein
MKLALFLIIACTVLVTSSSLGQRCGWDTKDVSVVIIVRYGMFDWVGKATLAANLSDLRRSEFGAT